MKGELIGAFVNEWRGRRVRIFEDKADPTMVYTEGWPLDATNTGDNGDFIATHEPRAAFAPYIGSYGKVYR